MLNKLHLAWVTIAVDLNWNIRVNGSRASTQLVEATFILNNQIKMCVMLQIKFL